MALTPYWARASAHWCLVERTTVIGTFCFLVSLHTTNIKLKDITIMESKYMHWGTLTSGVISCKYLEKQKYKNITPCHQAHQAWSSLPPTSILPGFNSKQQRSFLERFIFIAFVRVPLPSYIITTLCVTVGTDIFPKICASYFNLKPPWGPPLWNPRYYLNEFHKTLWLQSVIGLAFLCW